MECIIFVGIQASGKSTFYKQQFFSTHLRINLDMLKTRHREQEILTAAIHAKQSFVVDNTNPTKGDRKKYIEAAKSAGYTIIGYFFTPNYDVSTQRNEQRTGKEKVPAVAVRSTLKKLQPPEYEEGFDQLFLVTLQENEFIIETYE